MATTTNYGWATPDDTALVKDGASAIRTLGSSVDTTTKNLNPETTLGDLSFRSSTSNVNTRIPIGSSGQHLTVVAGVPAWSTASDQTPLTTKGDLFTFSTLDARLGVGANGTTLVADSSEATGLKWATPTGGGMTLLSTTSASGASFTISTIDQTYKNLYILGTNLSASADAELNFRVNGDTGSNYMFASPMSANATVQASFSNSATEGDAGAIGTTTAYNVAAFFEMTIPRYAETEYKKIHLRAGYKTSSTQYALSGTSWNNTAAITSLTFFQSGTFSSGTVFVYGVK